MDKTLKRANCFIVRLVPGTYGEIIDGKNIKNGFKSENLNCDFWLTINNLFNFSVVLEKIWQDCRKSAFETENSTCYVSSCFMHVALKDLLISEPCRIKFTSLSKQLHKHSA